MCIRDRIDSIEKFFQVEVYHPAVSFGDILLRLVHRLLCTMPRLSLIHICQEANCWITASIEKVEDGAMVATLVDSLHPTVASATAFLNPARECGD